jgi:hypothetical protein
MALTPADVNIPPSQGVSSTKTKCAPSLAAAMAALVPLTPPPMIKTSTFGLAKDGKENNVMPNKKATNLWRIFISKF